MENETNETRDITPEIARDMTQEAINWDGIVQRAINDRVLYRYDPGHHQGSVRAEGLGNPGLQRGQPSRGNPRGHRVVNL